MNKEYEDWLKQKREELNKGSDKKSDKFTSPKGGFSIRKERETDDN